MAGQRDIDKAAEQASLQAAAIVNHELRTTLKAQLKAAIKEIYWELWRDMFEYLVHASWFRIIFGLLTLLSLLGYWFKEFTEHLK